MNPFLTKQTCLYKFSYVLTEILDDRVTYNPVTTTLGKKPFAVCCKGLYFPTADLSLRLVEWIEVQRALGVDRITLPVLEVHPNMMKAK